MFCPKCGNPLIPKQLENGSSELYCTMGDMYVSQRLQQKLEERYGPYPLYQSPNPPFNQRFHGGIHWFCPGDGERLTAELECQKCGKHLRDLVYTLVELHPHKTAKGGYG
jgi:hypothetical protein